MSDRHVIDLRWSATGDGRKRRDPLAGHPGCRVASRPPSARPRQRVKNTHRTQQHNATTHDTTPNYEEQLEGSRWFQTNS